MQQSDGCGNCIQSPQGRAMQMQIKMKEAADYGKRNRVSTAIYFDGLQFEFAELAFARANNYPIAEVLSFDLSAPLT